MMLLPVLAVAAVLSVGAVPARVRRVIDGDTIVAAAPVIVMREQNLHTTVGGRWCGQGPLCARCFTRKEGAS
jgi:hypothetical protein